jgi:hypothetical protein
VETHDHPENDPMTPKRAFRPDALDRLESREVLSTSSLIQHVANPAQVFLPQTPVTNPHQAILNGGTQAAAVTSAASPYQYSVVSIKNSTSNPVHFSLRFGSGPWANFTLNPGQERAYYVHGLNQVATISFDKSFAPGFQEQRYSLASRNVVFPPGFYLVDPTPSAGSGKLYTFKGVPNGVQLYA